MFLFNIHYILITDDNVDSDIAILKLSSSLTFNSYVGSACLPPNENFYPENMGEDYALTSGWGLLKDSNYYLMHHF